MTPTPHPILLIADAGCANVPSLGISRVYFRIYFRDVTETAPDSADTGLGRPPRVTCDVIGGLRSIGDIEALFSSIGSLSSWARP